MDYTRMRAMANQQLKDKGLTCTITKQTAGTYSTSTGVASVSTSTQTAYGALFDYENKNIDGSLVKKGDRKLLLAALNTALAALTAPSVNDQVTANSVTYTIVAIRPIAPSGVAVAYDCQIRGIG
jgi:hypothetical protein